MSVRRLLLFDIDGTLVRGGPAKGAFHTALLETFGTAGDIHGLPFSGKTDPQIARELLHGAGLPHEEIDRALPELWRRYLGYLEEKLLLRPMQALGGVSALLEELSAFADVGVGLLTGNIVDGARLKLSSVGLWSHFHFGSYGSDHEDRDELPAVALLRARERWGRAVEPGEAIVIGDTPRDVACGRKGGARTLAVATGKFSVEELRATGADHVLPDLTSTREIVRLLVS